MNVICFTVLDRAIHHWHKIVLDGLFKDTTFEELCYALTCTNEEEIKGSKKGAVKNFLGNMQNFWFFVTFQCITLQSKGT